MVNRNKRSINGARFKKAAVSAALASLLLAPSISYAFVVDKIEIEGGNRISGETIRTYLPFRTGQNLDGRLTRETIERLYKTGFFKDVSLLQKDDSTLVIKVVERPSIAEIKMEGNNLIDSDALKDALDSLGLKKGRIYNQLDMDRIIIDLKRRYHNQGYYAASVEIISEELPRNRVDLKIKIVEGEPATIGRINLVGNHVYSDKRLKSRLQMSENATFGDGDKYSKPKLEADIETIKSYYMDHGYAEFKILSSQVSLSDDKTKVFITINMDEGPQYTINSVQFLGDTIVPQEEVERLITFKKGDVFSRSAVIDGVKDLRERLSEEGYAFAEVVPDSKLNKENRTIDLSVKVEPKSRVYIRRIEIEGNTRTRDDVIRRELRQLESAPYSLKAVRQSKERLARLGFFKSSDIQSKRVSDDEVDLVVKVEEQPTGSFSAGVTLSQLDGLGFNIGLSERNFIGSGNKLDLNIATTDAKKSADIGLTNPYFTPDGVSLGAGFYFREINADQLDIADYTTNNLGLRFSMGYPLSETNSINYGLKLDSQDLVCSDSFTYCHDYVSEYGKSTNSVQLSMGWSHNSTNSFYFPSKGLKTSLSFEAVLPGTSKASFYKVYADQSWFYPLSENISLQFKAGISYGDGYGDISELPFYENFYVGGIGSVRGFEPNSLGERYDLTLDGSDRPKGGSLKTVATTGLVFPVPFIEDSSNIRLSWFFDVGNVYKDLNAFDSAELRASTGLGVSWITPVGPLSFSFAQPVIYRSTDRTQVFQFTLGVGF
ncbi:outer membrane protein assembly factor BamA [Thiomicrorhabdus sp.]|uniref:outer membrane protein assembly factor BamA n=1 Tax=Thiomicrorhabdus sp. TaxID=2039724 RepID=UPI0029C62322|nr:outer membrane protein assembly factor BamA [Thiomicrorhabdus sp.]